MLQFQYTNGGRDKSKRSKQRNDCTVVSYAVALELPYDESYDYLRFAGRKSGRGFAMKSFMDSFFNRNRFEDITDNEIRAMSVIQLIESGKLSEGRYIVNVRRHVFAVIDGVIHDMHLMYIRGNFPQIYNVWKVVPYTQQTVKIKLKIGVVN